MTPASITLHFREGASDKVYQAALEPDGGLWSVRIAYGRRGGTLTPGTKTALPLAYDEARRVYDRLVQAKLAKGYTPRADGIPWRNTGGDSGRPPGPLPQLLNPVAEAEAEALLADDAWVLQEKLDGHRRLLVRSGNGVTAVNRRGRPAGLPAGVEADLLRLPRNGVLDGELTGDLCHVFDLLELDGEDLRPQPLERRLVALLNLLASAQCPHLPLVGTAFTPGDKGRRLREVRAARGEGVVFKRLDAPYTPGRPASGGPALKLKFTATLSAVVARLNGPRSVELRLLGTSGWQVAGHVGLPADHDRPEVGDVVEVRYLYAFPESGVLFQPVYLGLRRDVAPVECLASQLKFKPANGPEEADHD